MPTESGPQRVVALASPASKDAGALYPQNRHVYSGSPTGQTVIIKEFDNGATIDAGCKPTARTDLPPTLKCLTELGPFSILLEVWTTEEAQARPTRASYSLTVSSLDSSIASLTDGPSSISNNIASEGSRSSTASSPVPHNQLSSSTASDGLGIGAEIGSILGAIFGLFALVIAVYYGRKQLRSSRSRSRR